MRKSYILHVDTTVSSKNELIDAMKKKNKNQIIIYTMDDKEDLRNQLQDQFGHFVNNTLKTVTGVGVFSWIGSSSLIPGFGQAAAIGAAAGIATSKLVSAIIDDDIDRYKFFMVKGPDSKMKIGLLDKKVDFNAKMDVFDYNNTNIKFIEKAKCPCCGKKLKGDFVTGACYNCGQHLTMLYSTSKLKKTLK